MSLVYKNTFKITQFLCTIHSKYSKSTYITGSQGIEIKASVDKSIKSVTKKE